MHNVDYLCPVPQFDYFVYFFPLAIPFLDAKKRCTVTKKKKLILFKMV